MIDPRYEDPYFRGPELDGLSPDAAFDLAKQFRIAARNKRLAQKMGDERVRRHATWRAWGVALAISAIMLGLATAIWLVETFS